MRNRGPIVLPADAEHVIPERGGLLLAGTRVRIRTVWDRFAVGEDVADLARHYEVDQVAVEAALRTTLRVAASKRRRR